MSDPTEASSPAEGPSDTCEATPGGNPYFSTCSPDPKATHLSLGPDSFGDNTPASLSGRKRRSTSDIWQSIKRLKNKGAEVYGDTYTHVCVLCWQLLKLYKDKGSRSWQTTKGLNHLKLCPEAKKKPKLSRSLSLSIEKEADKKTKLQSVLHLSGQVVDSSDGTVTLAPLCKNNFSVSLRERALAAQAAWYVCSNQRVSKATFENSHFINMLQSMHAAGGGKGSCPRLRKRGLSLWVRAEYDNFLHYLRFMVKKCLEHSEGNPFCQVQHDGTTLADHHKRLAVGVQFVDPISYQNHVVCLGLVPLKNNSGVTGAATLEGVVTRTMGYSSEVLIHSVISDLAAVSVAKEMDQEADECEMHQSDKIGKSAIGDLVRTRKKIPINPFPEGQSLKNKCHKMATYFSYSTRHSELMNLQESTPGGFATIRIKVDLNETRVSAVYFLLLSEIRLNKPLQAYAAMNEVTWKLTLEEWQSVAEIESILGISATHATFVQNEKRCTAAFGVPMKQRLLDSLRSKCLSVVSLKDVEVSPKLKRVEVPVDQFSAVGKTTLQRAKLEAERRYCGNKTETVSGSNPVFTERDELAILLDPRTCNSAMQMGLDSDRLKVLTREVLPQNYVAFAKTALAHRNKLLMDEKRKNEPLTVVSSSTDTEEVKVAVDLGFDDYSTDEEVSDGEGDEFVMPTDEQLIDQCKRCHKKFRSHCKKFDWGNTFPGEERTRFPWHWWDVDVGGKVLKPMAEKDHDKKDFGFLPQMALASRGSIGALHASSFCERVNSCGNLVLTEGNTLLPQEEVNMLVTLRMNKNFLKFMRENHKHLGITNPAILEVDNEGEEGEA